jgi:ubiquinone/menaquinone biosynthesis C-methylase UbiE
MTKESALYHEVRDYIYHSYREIFPPDTDQFERHFKDVIEYEASEKLLEHVKVIADFSDNSKILDIGCGFGTFVLVCRQNSYKAYGIDLAKYEIEFAQKRFSIKFPNVSGIYQFASAERLPFKDNTFDVVTLWNLLEHVPDYRLVLTEADRVLKRGGFLFLVCPNYLTIREEAHYHLLWFSLIPKRIGAFYLKLRGRNPDFFMKSIYYTTSVGVSSYLRAMGYYLSQDKIKKLNEPSLCGSDFRRRLLKIIKLSGLSVLLRFIIRLGDFNPFKKSINICAVKPAR